MSEHTHLSGIDVSKDGALHFSFATHEDQPQAIAGMSVPAGHDAQRVAAQLQMLSALGQLSDKQVQPVVAHSKMDGVQALYTPEPKQPKPEQHPHAAQHQVHGQHTANYLDQMSTAPSQGQAI